jgi:hypothetical protein
MQKAYRFLHKRQILGSSRKKTRTRVIIANLEGCLLFGGE